MVTLLIVLHLLGVGPLITGGQRACSRATAPYPKKHGSISKWMGEGQWCMFFPTDKKPPTEEPNATACVVRYVACGNLKHTLKVEKRSNPQPRGRADPERQLLGAEASGALLLA